MSRLKIFILVLIIGALAIVFIQNQETVALKLLCKEVDSQYCLLQTAKQPLAIWISLFVTGGIITNLISQVFSRYSYASFSKKRYFEDQKTTDDRDTNCQIKNNTTKDRKSTTNSYEASQKPQKVERSGSNYSYKYRPTDKAQNGQTNTRKKSIDLGKDTNIASEPEDEDWI